METRDGRVLVGMVGAHHVVWFGVNKPSGPSRARRVRRARDTPPIPTEFERNAPPRAATACQLSLPLPSPLLHTLPTHYA